MTSPAILFWCSVVAIIFSLGGCLGPIDAQTSWLMFATDLLFTIAAVISAYMYGYEYHKTKVHDINVVHTLFDNTKKIRITEFDDEGAIIKSTELIADSRWQSGFTKVVAK